MTCMAERKENVVRFYVDLDGDDHHRLRMIAAAERKTMKAVIVDCIRKHDPASHQRTSSGASLTTETRADYET